MSMRDILMACFGGHRRVKLSIWQGITCRWGLWPRRSMLNRLCRSEQVTACCCFLMGFLKRETLVVKNSGLTGFLVFSYWVASEARTRLSAVKFFLLVLFQKTLRNDGRV